MTATPIPPAPNEQETLARLLPELVRLSPTARIAAIHELVDSMQPVAAGATQPTELSAPRPRQNLLDFAGVWNDEEEANIMEQAILDSRYSEVTDPLQDRD